MFTFISIMAVGVLIGYPLRRKQSIHKIPVLIQIVVCLLLFILGLSIGTNKLIIGNLSYFCQGGHHLHAESVRKLCSRSPCVSLFL